MSTGKPEGRRVLVVDDSAATLEILRRNLQAARRLLEKMDADMGGTEIGPALEMAYASRTPGDISVDLLLITDGEVWDVDPVLERAAASGHRIFTVGVGSAVSEGFLRTLARRTGGACELVTPNEQMAERIVRHFRRIGSPKIQEARIRWPATGVEQVPARIESVYRDETLHAFARCDGITGEEVVLELGSAAGDLRSFQTVVHPVPWAVESPALLARLAVARQLREEEMDAEEATKLALRYQLLTPHTGVLVVAPREEGEKAADLPELRQVPHMLAAGWGGMGTVQEMSAAPPLMESSAFLSLQLGRSVREESLEVFGERMPDTDAELAGPEGPGAEDFVENLCRRLAHRGRIADLDELGGLGLEEEYLDRLWSLVHEEHGEEDVVTVFLFLLSGRLSRGSVDRNAMRHLRRDYRQIMRQGGWEDVVSSIERWVGEIAGLV